MKDELTLGQAERFHQLTEELKGLAGTAMMHLYRLGEIMKEVRDQELWKAGYDSFKAFYSDPELDYSESSVWRSIKMVENFTLEELNGVQVGKMYVILPHVEESNKAELLRMAESLSRGDLIHQLNIKRLVEKVPKIEKMPRIYPCNVCGGAKGIAWEQLCHCGWTPKQIEYVGKLIDKINFGGELDDEN